MYSTKKRQTVRTYIFDQIHNREGEGDLVCCLILFVMAYCGFIHLLLFYYYYICIYFSMKSSSIYIYCRVINNSLSCACLTLDPPPFLTSHGHGGTVGTTTTFCPAVCRSIKLSKA